MSQGRLSKVNSKNVNVSYLKVDPQYTGSKLSNQPTYNGVQPAPSLTNWTDKSIDDEIPSAKLSANNSNLLKYKSGNRLTPHLLEIEFETENSNRVTYFVMSCLVATFINPIFGLAAVLASLKSHNLFMTRTAPERKKAHFYGRVAFSLNVLGITVTMLSLIFFFYYWGDSPNVDSSPIQNLQTITLSTISP